MPQHETWKLKVIKVSEGKYEAVFNDRNIMNVWNIRWPGTNIDDIIGEHTLELGDNDLLQNYTIILGEDDKIVNHTIIM